MGIALRTFLLMPNGKHLEGYRASSAEAERVLDRLGRRLARARRLAAGAQSRT